MAVLSKLQPERVFHYFEELCQIPHGSHNTKQVSDWLANFAKERGLWYSQDEANNIIIKKPAAKGCEAAPTVILQGHCDMVCEKTPESTHDFTKDPLELMIEGDFVTAKDTTLGGDDGIAVAYILALLEDDTLRAPAIEAVITTDEEVGLLGAKALDTSQLEGRRLINLDSEEEGYLWVGCAGGLRALSTLNVERVSAKGAVMDVVIDGLKGGHSGAEIDKNRANSNKLMGRFLWELGKTVPYRLAGLEGGLKDNAIPRSTTAKIVVEASAQKDVFTAAIKCQQDLRGEYSGSDEGITIRCRQYGEAECRVLKDGDKEKALFLLNFAPWGVVKMSGDIEGLVETSSNPGVMKLEEEKFLLDFSIRSSKGSAKKALAEKLTALTEFLGGSCAMSGDYPAWEYRKDSPLRDLMADTYEEMFGEKPLVQAIHAGLECGLFYEKMPGLDCVSFGPTMHDIHTTEETLSISSTERMWNYLIKVLEKLAG